MFGKKESELKEEIRELKAELSELKARLDLIKKVVDGDSTLSPTEVDGWIKRRK